MQRIEFQADVIDFQIERTVVAGPGRHRHAEALDLVERNPTLAVLDASLGRQEELGEGNLCLGAWERGECK